MSAKIFFIIAILGVAKAGFLGTPSVVVPSFGRRTTTVYHGSALSYHPNTDYRTNPQEYDGQYAVTTSPVLKADDNNARDLSSTSMASNSDGRRNEDNLDNSSASSYSNNRKEAERPRGRTQNENMDGRPDVNDNASSGDNRNTNMESKTSTTSPISSAPTQILPGADKLVLVAAPAFYHATPVPYHAPLTYDTQVTYHGPIAHTAFSSAPNGKFAYSTSQISYGPSPSSLLEDCLTCPQTTSQDSYNQNQSSSLEDCLTCPQPSAQISYSPQPTATLLEDCLTCPQA